MRHRDVCPQYCIERGRGARVRGTGFRMRGVGHMILCSCNKGQKNIDEEIYFGPGRIIEVFGIPDCEEPDWSEYSEHMRPIDGGWC